MKGIEITVILLFFAAGLLVNVASCYEDFFPSRRDHQRLDGILESVCQIRH